MWAGGCARLVEPYEVSRSCSSGLRTRRLPKINKQRTNCNWLLDTFISARDSPGMRDWGAVFDALVGNRVGPS